MRRLARLGPPALRESLREDDREVRQAAALACARERRRELVPELIALLEDPEPDTARRAENGLRELTGQHFTHPEGWRAWWKSAGTR